MIFAHLGVIKAFDSEELRRFVYTPEWKCNVALPDRPTLHFHSGVYKRSVPTCKTAK